MIKTSHIIEAAGQILAPWVNLTGRLIKSQSLVSMALKFDPIYMRSMPVKLAKTGHDSFEFNQLLSAQKLIAACSPEASKHIKEMISNSNGQLLQDMVCLLVNNMKSEGVFIEVGVGNGSDISNTYMLEKEYNWTGLLVEPSRGFHHSIKECRTATLDIRAAAFVGGQEVLFEENLDNGEFSKISSVDSGHELLSDLKTTYKVNTETITNILQDHDLPSCIDFMSIDTEGTEIEILNSFDFNKYNVGFFAIEHNNRPHELASLDEIFLNKGYRRILPEISQWDAWYVHETIDSKFL